MARIRLENTLWSTRGKEWGFRFLHTPRPYSQYWWAAYQEIFAKDARVPLRWWGSIRFPDGNAMNYVASRFVDEEEAWRDAAGREIPQELLFLIDEVGMEEIRRSAWESVAFQGFRDQYREVYEKSVDEIAGVAIVLDEELAIQNSSNDCDAIELNVDLRSARQGKGSGQSPSATGKTIWRLMNTDVLQIPREIKKLRDET